MRVYLRCSCLVLINNVRNFGLALASAAISNFLFSYLAALAI